MIAEQAQNANAEMASFPEAVGETKGELWTIILKVAARCDLACIDCYEEHDKRDGRWRQMKPFMFEDVVDALAGRLAEHHAQSPSTRFSIILHGGEPLKAGKERLARTLQTLSSALPPEALEFRMVTNGGKLDEGFLDLFLQHNVMVGISLDGNKQANDLMRVGPKGRSTYEQTVRAINLLRSKPYKRLFAGLLCTVDLRANPVDAYEHLAGFEPPRIDFNLPHATWGRPSRGIEGRALAKIHQAATPYADWLKKAFNAWYNEPEPRRTDVRLFSSILKLGNGEASDVDTIGLTPTRQIVIRTDGSVELDDSLNVVGHDAPQTGLNVLNNSLGEVMAHPAISSRALGRAGLRAQLAPVCQDCDIVRICGAGLRTHRASKDNNFENPSVYCPDLADLIVHILGVYVKRDLTDLKRGVLDAIQRGYSAMPGDA